MVSQIRILKGKLENYQTESAFTGWFGIKRLSPEGPYEPVIFSKQTKKFFPQTGPLANTEIDFPSIWCAVSEGKLVIAPRTSESAPPVYEKNMHVRGFYYMEPVSREVVWSAIDKPWDENEIHEFSILSNPSYTLYKKVPLSPQFLFFFGAGASYGSDGKFLYERGLLPPLGNNLYQFLREDKSLTYWKNVPKEIEEIFYKDFEEGMMALDKYEDSVKNAFSRDIELSLYFSKFRPEKTNLYWRLGKIISKRIKGNRWSGAAITLNYERLLEESFMRNSVFTAVKGITFYNDNIPEIQDDQIFEICYPHGSCQFFLGQSCFGPNLNIVFGETARFEGNTGANHLLKYSNIPIACERRQIPLICRYHPSKRASVNNYFIDTQKARAQELILNAKQITIVGVKCHHLTDEHIWEPLSNTKALIVYVEPGTYGQSQFVEWANSCGKSENVDYKIIPKTFKDSFSELIELNGLS